MSDPEVLLPTNKLFFFPFMAAGLTCSMMLHIPILTFIFHQSFLPHYIKQQLRAKMWPQTPLSDFFLTTPQCWLDWHAILQSITVDTLIVSGDCGDTWSRPVWLRQHFATQELSSILFIRKSRAVDVDEWWASVVFVFVCCCCVWYDPHSHNPPKDGTAVTVKSRVFHSLFCSVGKLSGLKRCEASILCSVLEILLPASAHVAYPDYSSIANNN